MSLDQGEKGVRPEQIGQRARAAAGWQFLSRSLNTGLHMVVSVVLARLLMPKDFGIVAMATMVTGLAGIFSDLGLGQALVQRQEITTEHTGSAFWGTLVMGLLLWGLVILVAPWVGAYFGEPRMVPVLRLISLTFVLSPFAVVPRSLLQRSLDFRAPFFAGLASSVAYGVAGIAGASLGYGYWSLVSASLASAFVSTMALCIVTRYTPPLMPTFRGIVDLYSFGVGMTGVGLFNYVAGQLDYLVIGRRFDASALGLYSRAYTLVDTLRQFLSGVTAPILFPAFSALQADTERAKQVFGTVVRTVAALSFPILALIGVSAPEFVPLVFGVQWRGAVAPTQLLVLAGVLRVVTNPAGALVNGLGRVYSGLACQAAYAVVLAGGAWYGADWGLEGVALAVLFSSVVFFVAYAHATNRACAFSLADYAVSMASPILLAALVAVGGVGARRLVATTAAPDEVILGATVGGGVLAGVLALAGPARSLRPIFNGALSVLQGSRGRSSATG